MIWLFVLWLLALILGLFFGLMAIVSGVIRYTKRQERQQRKKRINCIKKGQGTIIDMQEDNTIKWFMDTFFIRPYASNIGHDK